MGRHSLSYSSTRPKSNDVPFQEVLIYFICGNPGLISYYETFLSSLSQLIDSSAASKSGHFDIYGEDLAGFNDDDHEPFSKLNPPRNVAYQINHLFELISGLRVQDGPKKGQPYDEVLLVGHSVGSYIALELFHKHLKDPDSAPHLNLRTGILLFPTIEHIGQSPSGLRLNMLRRTPFLAQNAHRIASGFLGLLPYNALHWFVSKVLGFPQEAATVTTRWLKSRDGVWQALHMGMDEMEVIGEDKWDEELWEIADTARAHHQLPPKFYFFFGKHDHWVASHLRDAFIEKRQKQIERTKLMVDEGNLPHAFCIKHSEVVAEKANNWINEVYQTA